MVWSRSHARNRPAARTGSAAVRPASAASTTSSALWRGRGNASRSWRVDATSDTSPCLESANAYGRSASERRQVAGALVSARGAHHSAACRYERCLLYTSDAADERSSVDLG